MRFDSDGFETRFSRFDAADGREQIIIGACAPGVAVGTGWFGIFRTGLLPAPRAAGWGGERAGLCGRCAPARAHARRARVEGGVKLVLPRGARALRPAAGRGAQFGPGGHRQDAVGKPPHADLHARHGPAGIGGAQPAGFVTAEEKQELGKQKAEIEARHGASRPKPPPGENRKQKAESRNRGGRPHKPPKATLGRTQKEE